MTIKIAEMASVAISLKTACLLEVAYSSSKLSREALEEIERIGYANGEITKSCGTYVANVKRTRDATADERLIYYIQKINGLTDPPLGGCPVSNVVGCEGCINRRKSLEIPEGICIFRKMYNALTDEEKNLKFVEE